MSASSVDAKSPLRRSYVWLLLGLLAVLATVYVATSGYRRNALLKAELIRREVAAAEKQRDEELEARKKRHERLGLVTRLGDAPEDVPTLLRAAALYAQDGEYEDALFLLHEVRRLQPSHLEAYRALYQAYIAQGQYDRAYDYAVEGLKQAPKDLELLLGLVHLDSLVGWNFHARRQLRQLEGTPEAENPRVRIASALIYRQVADSLHATQDLEAAVAKEPHNDKALALLSGVVWETGDGPKAEGYIRRAIELAPENADYLLHLAEILRLRKTPAALEEAHRVAERALKNDPGNRHAFFAIAKALLAAGKTSDAEEILERLLERYPDHAQASLELAQIYAASKRPKEAEPLHKRYADGMRRGDALKSLTLKVAMREDAFEPHRDLGKLYNDLGESTKAVLVLRRALQLRPGDPVARKELARALAATGRSGEYAELATQPQWHALDVLAD